MSGWSDGLGETERGKASGEQCQKLDKEKKGQG